VQAPQRWVHGTRDVRWPGVGQWWLLRFGGHEQVYARAAGDTHSQDGCSSNMITMAQLYISAIAALPCNSNLGPVT